MSLAKSIVRRTLICVLALAACSCGQPLVIVKGQVAQDGKPLLSYRTARVRVKFHLLDNADKPTGHVYVATTTRGGGFEVRGEQDKGIPIGKYRISVEIYDRNENDQLNGAVGPENSPFVRSVTPEMESLSIDITRPS